MCGYLLNIWLYLIYKVPKVSLLMKKHRLETQITQMKKTVYPCDNNKNIKKRSLQPVRY